MPFRLPLEEPAALEVRAALLEQCDLALEALAEGPTKGAVHEARKACKRCRATLRLVRAGMRRKVWRGADRAFRDAARHIGPVRDADVMRDTLASMGAPGDQVREPDDREALGAAAVEGLRVARALVDGLDLARVDRDTLAVGLVDSWRDARGGLRHARTDRDAEAFHEWRKAVKRLGYHLQLLHGLAPEVLGAVEAGLDVLQESLGDHHDLAVLADQVHTREEIRADLAARAGVLEERVLRLGAWWFAAKPRTLRRFLEAFR